MADRVLVDIDTEFANKYKYNIADPKLRPHLFYFYTDNTYSLYIRKLRRCYAVCGNLPADFLLPNHFDVYKSIYFEHPDFEYVVQEFRAILKKWILSYNQKYERIQFDFSQK